MQVSYRLMSNLDYPRLHLPPWFEEAGGEEYAEIKEWTGAGFVELESGEFVKPTFVSLVRIEGEMRNPEKAFWFDEDSIILKKVSIEQIRMLLPELEKAGVFNSMRRYPAVEWDE